MKNMFIRVVLLFTFFVNGLVLNVAAQLHHFIYIQADNNQPFYVLLNNKTYSSSDIGYMIIPKLTDGEYSFKLGFPKNIYPEQNFTCTINQNDLGFQLKNFGDKGWGLINLQTLAVVMAGNEIKPGTPARDSTVKTVAQNPNAFGEMLSDVVDDSTLTRKNSETPAVINIPAVTKSDTVQKTNIAAINVATDSSVSQMNTDTVAAAADTKGIIKASEETTDKGTSLVFIDFNNTSNDTVNVFIPANNIDVAKADTGTAKLQTASLPADTAKAVSSIDNTKPLNTATLSLVDSSKINGQVSVPGSKTVNNPFYTAKTDSAANENTVSAQTVQSAATVPGNTSLVKNDCIRMATEIDLDKIKKKMVVESDATKMILDAKKILKDKCVTTDEVKNLGALFLSDEGRYNFYDAMYGYTFDYGTYSSLESQLIDNYYKKRFEAMLR